MKEYQAGSQNYAEIVIDYRKKDVQILDPEKKEKYKPDDRWSPRMIYLLIAMIILVIFSKVITLGNNWWWVSGIGYVIVYLIFALFNLYPKFNELIQKLSHREWWGERKYMIVKKINGKEYTLPYEFTNRVLNYTASGQFEKYLTKVHIRPKQYFIKVRKKITPQKHEWEVIFYFSKIPKQGQLEIEWL